MSSVRRPDSRPRCRVMEIELADLPTAEPDLSNPTRSRWERPLDTIRSFEASIDQSNRRRSVARAGMSTHTGITLLFHVDAVVTRDNASCRDDQQRLQEHSSFP